MLLILREDDSQVAKGNRNKRMKRPLNHGVKGIHQLTMTGACRNRYREQKGRREFKNKGKTDTRLTPHTISDPCTLSGSVTRRNQRFLYMVKVAPNWCANINTAPPLGVSRTPIRLFSNCIHDPRGRRREEHALTSLHTTNCGQHVSEYSYQASVSGTSLRLSDKLWSYGYYYFSIACFNLSRMAVRIIVSVIPNESTKLHFPITVLGDAIERPHS
jgi:hypothetical protein